MSICRVSSCVVGRECLLWPVHSLGKTLLASALFHFVLHGQTSLLFQVSLDFLLLNSSPLWWKGLFFFFSPCVSSRRSCRSSYTTLPAPWETYMQIKKQQLEADMEQRTGSKLIKKYINAAYCHPAYLGYMQSISCKMPTGWSISWNQDCQKKCQ